MAPTTNAVADAEVMVSVPEMLRPVKVPTLVNDEAVTPEAKVVPVSVPAAAVTVILAVPSNDTPLIVRGVCRAVAVPALPLTEVWSPVLVPLLLPEKLEPPKVLVQAKAPVELVTVQPVELDPPPSKISPVLVLPRLRAPEPLASIDKASLVPEEIAARFTPAAAALEVTDIPVAELAVLASILKAGLVPPLAPTTKADADAEVIV